MEETTGDKHRHRISKVSQVADISDSPPSLLHILLNSSDHHLYIPDHVSTLLLAPSAFLMFLNRPDDIAGTIVR